MEIRQIYEYSDYRTYLKEFYSARKKERSGKWGLTVWARSLGLKSPSTLAMILSGQRNPSPKLVSAMTKNLKLTPREGEYFSDLVTLQRHRHDTRLSVLVMEKLGREHPSGSFKLLNPDIFSLVSNWYHYAIREMVHLKDFRENSTWIAGRLNFGITPKQVQHAIATLLRLGLLTRSRWGRLSVSVASVDTDPNVGNEALWRYHEQILHNASKAVRCVPPRLREINGMTFCMNQANLPKAKAMLRKFKDEFTSLMEDTPGDAVYHLELAFYPLTKFDRETRQNLTKTQGETPNEK